MTLVRKKISSSLYINGDTLMHIVMSRGYVIIDIKCSTHTHSVKVTDNRFPKEHIVSAPGIIVVGSQSLHLISDRWL